MADLCDLSAVELRRLIGAGEVSPVEVVKSCLARIDKVNGTVNAFVARSGQFGRFDSCERICPSRFRHRSCDLGVH